ncbi:hypothetical protein BJ165DRAFT_1448584 [Panaeolus papilionaceus]|nr:hypothetical protein BJ165DRAFT_1448584 [Panaeolus papilionaceus]
MLTVIFAATIYLWDLSLTTYLDVELVWPSKFSTIKLLYLFQRYLPLLTTVWALIHEDVGVNMTADSCGALGKFGGYSILAGYIAGEAILTVRTWSAWNRNKKLGVGLITMFTAVWTSMFVILHLFIHSINILRTSGPHVTGCFLEVDSHGMRTFWAIFLGWSTLLLTLLLIPTVKNGHLRSRTLLYNAVFQKGTIYYFCICAILFFSIICDSYLPPHYMPLFRGLQPCLHSMLTSKAILAIRGESRRQWQANLDSQCLRTDPGALENDEPMPDFTESVLRDTCTRLERDLGLESGSKVQAS